MIDDNYIRTGTDIEDTRTLKILGNYAIGRVGREPFFYAFNDLSTSNDLNEILVREFKSGGNYFNDGTTANYKTITITREWQFDPLFTSTDPNSIHYTTRERYQIYPEVIVATYDASRNLVRVSISDDGLFPRTQNYDNAASYPSGNNGSSTTWDFISISSVFSDYITPAADIAELKALFPNTGSTYGSNYAPLNISNEGSYYYDDGTNAAYREVTSTSESFYSVSQSRALSYDNNIVSSSYNSVFSSLFRVIDGATSNGFGYYADIAVINSGTSNFKRDYSSLSSSFKSSLVTRWPEQTISFDPLAAASGGKIQTITRSPVDSSESAFIFTQSYSLLIPDAEKYRDERGVFNPSLIDESNCSAAVTSYFTTSFYTNGLFLAYRLLSSRGKIRIITDITLRKEESSYYYDWYNYTYSYNTTYTVIENRVSTIDSNLVNSVWTSDTIGKAHFPEIPEGGYDYTTYPYVYTSYSYVDSTVIVEVLNDDATWSPIKTIYDSSSGFVQLDTDFCSSQGFVLEEFRRDGSEWGFAYLGDRYKRKTYTAAEPEAFEGYIEIDTVTGNEDHIFVTLGPIAMNSANYQLALPRDNNSINKDGKNTSFSNIITNKFGFGQYSMVSSDLIDPSSLVVTQTTGTLFSVPVYQATLDIAETDISIPANLDNATIPIRFSIER